MNDVEDFFKQIKCDRCEGFYTYSFRNNSKTCKHCGLNKESSKAGEIYYIEIKHHLHKNYMFGWSIVFFDETKSSSFIFHSIEFFKQVNFNLEPLTISNRDMIKKLETVLLLG